MQRVGELAGHAYQLRAVEVERVHHEVHVASEQVTSSPRLVVRLNGLPRVVVKGVRIELEALPEQVLTHGVIGAIVQRELNWTDETGVAACQGIGPVGCISLMNHD